MMLNHPLRQRRNHDGTDAAAGEQQCQRQSAML